MQKTFLLAHAFLLMIGIFCISNLKSEENATQEIRVDTSKANSNYTNFVRVTGTPEELIIDFGLNTVPAGVPKDPIQIKQQIVMNIFTAKRFEQSLTTSLDRHEAAFGKIETDVMKRVKQ